MGPGPRGPSHQSFTSFHRRELPFMAQDHQLQDWITYSNPQKKPKKIERSTAIQRVVTYYLFTFQPLEPQIDLTPGNAAGTPGAWMGSRSPVHAVSWHPRAPGSHQTWKWNTNL